MSSLNLTTYRAPHLFFALPALAAARHVTDVHRGAPVLLVGHAAILPLGFVVWAFLSVLFMLLLLLLLMMLGSVLLLLTCLLVVPVNVPESAVNGLGCGGGAPVYEAVEPLGDPVSQMTRFIKITPKARLGGNSIGFFGPNNGPNIGPKCHLKRLYAGYYYMYINIPWLYAL